MDVADPAQHARVRAIQHLLHLVIYSPAFTAIDEYGLYGSDKEPFFEIRFEVGLLYLVHIV